MPIADGTKFYASATFITQQKDYVSALRGPYSYTGTGYDVFAKIDVQDFEAFGYYYHGSGLGTTGLFVLSDAILAADKFVGGIPLPTLWNLSSYWLAQWFIAGAAARPHGGRALRGGIRRGPCTRDDRQRGI